MPLAALKLGHRRLGGSPLQGQRMCLGIRLPLPLGLLRGAPRLLLSRRFVCLALRLGVALTLPTRLHLVQQRLGIPVLVAL
jgi:hypothetical protein